MRALGVKTSEGAGLSLALYPPPSFSSSRFLWASKAWTRALEPEGKSLAGSLVWSCRREEAGGEVDGESSAEKQLNCGSEQTSLGLRCLGFLSGLSGFSSLCSFSNKNVLSFPS